MATEKTTRITDKVVAEMVDCTPKSPSIEFLEELRERARRYGWAGDYVEIRDFVASLYKDAGLDRPELDPYPL